MQFPKVKLQASSFPLIPSKDLGLILYLCSVAQSKLLRSHVACQAPLSMEFLSQEYWSTLPFSTREHLPNPGIETMSLASPSLGSG